LYGSSAQTQWQQGSDFIRFSEQGFTREARGFHSVDTFVAGQAHSLASESMATAAHWKSEGAGSEGAFTPDSPSHWVSPSIDTSAAEPHQRDEIAEQYSELETFHSPLARQTLPELQVLRETRDMSDWLSERLRPADETLLVDPDSEFALLDEIFSKR
ncbi:MAG: hypothetical protein KDA51_01775, partial [Planctomycetales bacterium]|nr:hypothetical protein [Planctomycetales bacterium]